MPSVWRMSDAPIGGSGTGSQGSYAAGWYPLPDGRSERYWDGSQWTDAVRPLGGAAVPPPPAFPPSAGGPGAQYAAGQAPYHGQAIASMVLGIVSLVFWCGGLVTGIIGLVLGITSLKSTLPRGPKRGRGMAIAGIACSAVALALWGIVALFFAIGSSSGY